MLNDLLKASDQKPIDQEQFLIQESLASDLEKKTITRVDEMMHNGVNIQRMIKDIDRLRADVEKLKDGGKKNGNGYSSVMYLNSMVEHTFKEQFELNLMFEKKRIATSNPQSVDYNV